MRSRRSTLLLSASITVLLLAAKAGATPWGEDRPVPTEDECAAFFDSLYHEDTGGGGGGGSLPPDCDRYSETRYSQDLCGCSIEGSIITVCPASSTELYYGELCSLEAAYTYNATDETMSAASGNVSVGGDGGSAGTARAVAEALWAVRQLADDAGRDLDDGFGGELASSTGADTVINDADVDAGDQSLNSLEVNGIYVVLGDLDVTERAEINGLLIVQGDLRVGDLVIDGAGIAPFGVGGGMVFALSATADSLEADGCILYLRDLLTNDEGSAVIAGAARVDGCFVDAGTGLTAGGDLSVADSTLASRHLEGSTLTLLASTVSRLGTVVAGSLSATASALDAPGRLEITVAGDTTMVESAVYGAGVELESTTISVDTASLVEARHRDDAGLVLSLDPDESEATGLYTEQVPGASFGGYGGTESWLNSNSFRPAAAPTGDPRDPTGHGVDGWALSWSTTTYGGGGGNDVVIRADTATLDGVITANAGHAPVGVLGGGGSGGSGGVVRVDVGVLGGSARIEANGGNGSVQAEGNSTGLAGGGGSGGRIAVLAERFEGFDFSYEAVGGLGAVYEGVLEGRAEEVWWDDVRTHGGPGTVYEREGALPGRLLVDGNGLDPAEWGCGAGPQCRGIGWLPADLSGDDVIVRDATVALLDLNARSLTLEGADLVPDDPRARLSWPLPWFFVEDGMSASQVYWPADVYADPLGEQLSFTLDTDLWVDTTSRVALAGYGGYARSTPEGEEDKICWSGGSHGGVGGSGYIESRTQTEPEPAFDDELAPTAVGSGGCGDFAWTPVEHALCGVAGMGGAALSIVAGRTVRVDGVVDVSGFPGRPETEDMYCISNLGNAGGAGGALWIVAASIEGSGVMDVGGGDGAANLTEQACGGGGGGGRLAAQVETDAFAGTIVATGGEPGCDAAESGADGSIHLEAMADTGDSGEVEDTGEPNRRGENTDDPTETGCGCASGEAPAGVFLSGAGAALLRRRRRG